MTPPTTIDRTSASVASIDAEEFARAQQAESTTRFWQSVDDYEREIAERGEDHVAAAIDLP